MSFLLNNAHRNLHRESRSDNRTDGIPNAKALCDSVDSIRDDAEHEQDRPKHESHEFYVLPGVQDRRSHFIIAEHGDDCAISHICPTN